MIKETSKGKIIIVDDGTYINDIGKEINFNLSLPDKRYGDICLKGIVKYCEKKENGFETCFIWVKGNTPADQKIFEAYLKYYELNIELEKTRQKNERNIKNLQDNSVKLTESCKSIQESFNNIAYQFSKMETLSDTLTTLKENKSIYYSEGTKAIN